MKLEWIDPAHHVHMMAVVNAGVLPRLVLLFPMDALGYIDEVVGTFCCPRKRACATCAWHLADKRYVTVGLVQRRSPVEVQRVGDAETATPAAPGGFPQAPSV